VRTARLLRPLLGEFVFVGGQVAELLVTDATVVRMRPTDDVDVVVPVTTRRAYHDLQMRLIALGFSPDQRAGAPICRMRTVDDLVLDVMPLDEKILGFSNRWYPYAVGSATAFTLEPGLVVRLASSAAFLATKWVAFASRGAADPMSSHDLEDLVTVVGSPDDLAQVEAFIGERSHVELDRDQSALDATRVFVSSRGVVGIPLAKLDLINKHAAIITRVRRGDLWFVPDGDTVLELGDRVRVTTRRDNIEAIEEFFGDSYRELSEVSFLTFAMGLAAGLALGQLPIPLSHGIVFKLGFAGGPLAMALILGRFHRIGPLVWNFPYSANHTIRQFGLVLFAAGIGVLSGEGFRAILSKDASVLPLFLGAAFLVCFVADSLTMILGYKLFGIPLNIMFGILAGTHTQPVVLGYANHHTGNELPNVGFATVYPLATILKIVLAQVLLVLIH